MFKGLKFNFSLRANLIIFVIAPLMLTIAAITYFGLSAMETIIENNMQKDVELVGRALRVPVSYSLEKERFGSVVQSLDSVFRIGRLYGAYVYDNEGKRIASVGSVKPSSKGDNVEKLTEKGEGKGKYEEIEGREVYSYFVPLFDTKGAHIGLLQITRKKSDFVGYIKKLRVMTLFLLLGAGIFMSVLILVGFHGAVGKYLNLLAGSMSKVRAGNKQHRANINSPKEISSLAQSLNSMLDSITQAEEEIAERRDAQEKLEKIAITDKMTGLFTRSIMETYLEQEASRARRQGLLFSVVLFDIDHFKAINDHYGHTVGDRILKDFSSRLLSRVRESDILGRWGGEEFLVICPDTEATGASKLAEDIRQDVQDFSFGLQGRVTLSAGVASFTEGVYSVEDLVNRADKALYKAKEQRNSVSVFQSWE